MKNEWRGIYYYRSEAERDAAISTISIIGFLMAALWLLSLL